MKTYLIFIQDIPCKQSLNSTFRIVSAPNKKQALKIYAHKVGIHCSIFLQDYVYNPRIDEGLGELLYSQDEGDFKQKVLQFFEGNLDFCLRYIQFINSHPDGTMDLEYSFPNEMIEFIFLKTWTSECYVVQLDEILLK